MNQILTYRRIVAFLPKELGELVKSYCNPFEEHWQGKVDEIAEKYDLNRWGFKTNKTKNIYSKLNLKNIMKCKYEIPHIFRPLKTYSKNCVGSYGGKHVVERFRDNKKDKDPYIANGEFIAAMILNNYVPKIYGINCEFKAKKINKDL